MCPKNEFHEKEGRSPAIHVYLLGRCFSEMLNVRLSTGMGRGDRNHGNTSQVPPRGYRSWREM